jgi:hypothetical protein
MKSHQDRKKFIYPLNNKKKKEKKAKLIKKIFYLFSYTHQYSIIGDDVGYWEMEGGI